MEPVYLRHQDATRQAVLYGSFAVVVTALLVAAFAVPLPGKWALLIFAPVALFLAYSALRLAALRVRVDERGIWEPNPFRLSYVTPWDDVAKVRKSSTPGALKLRFIGVEVVHKNGGRHDILALKVQSRAAYAESVVEEWIDTIRKAQSAAR